MTNFIPDLPDFWGRQANAPHHRFAFTPLGTPVEIITNHAPVLQAARLAAGRYCQSAARAGAPVRLQLVVRSQVTPPVPEDWPESLVYSGLDRWITVSGGEWGHGFANLETRQALVFLSPALAAETVLVSRYFIDHYLLNFLLADWAMLHASGVVAPAGGALILLVGAHNTGKSTTALRLVRAGDHFLADGMALIQFNGDQLCVGGYPIGEVKLRDDLCAAWPEYAGETMRVREHHKTVVNLRAVHPGQIIEQVITPPTVHVCFTERADGLMTSLSPLSSAAAETWLAANTVFWDEPARLEHNARTLRRLLALAHLHHLRLGADATQLLRVLQSLQ